MRMIAIGALLMAGVSAAHAQLSPAATEAAKAYQACMKQAAVTLDDGKSDAATIGLGIVSFCSVQRRNFAVTSSHGNFELQTYTQRAIDAKAPADATAWVLAMRAARAKK